nr:MAG TPA: hypothetical protein [Caudoviricetes sp.]
MGCFTIHWTGVSTLYRGHARASGVIYDSPHRAPFRTPCPTICSGRGAKATAGKNKVISSTAYDY